MTRHPLIIAHRGNSAAAPENTLVAFSQAISLGVDAIEFDVWMTADQHPVVIHDDTVDRTTNGSGRIDAITLAQVQYLDAGSWFGAQFAGQHLPTLSDALALMAASDCLLEMEVKANSCTAAIQTALVAMQEVARLDLSSRVIVNSPFAECLAMMHTSYPTVRTALTVDAQPGTNFMPGVLQEVQRVQGQMLTCPYALITPQIVSEAHRAGLQVYAWTLDDPHGLRMLLDAGVDGVISNDPGALIKALQPRRPQVPAYPD